LEAQLRTELNVVLQEIETFWFQKSRVNAIRDGDRNTKYFHISTIIRRRLNRIEALQHEDGHWITSSVEVQKHVVDFFSSLYTESTPHPQIDLPSGLFPQPPEDKLTKLYKPYSPEEIVLALRSMDPYKAPGPDGFQALFFQKFWNLVGPNVNDVVLGVLNGQHLPEGLNDTFLVLLPKVEHPQKVTQFRPIGLCNVAYKLITKVLVHRLKKVLPDIISPCQSSFVPGRQISDNIIIMQESLHTMRKKRGRCGFMAIKLDLEKAYDRLNWAFTRHTLMEMRLPQLMVEVIMLCITSYSMRILWNGEPTASFQPTRGIRQGDPLSPYIFVACMERLSHLIEGLVQSGQWKPLRVCQNGPQVSSLFFADDIVLFAKANITQARLIQECLTRFCMASGQKVSASKSRIYFSPNTHASEMANVCNVLGIEPTDDLGKYLGVPTINGRVKKSQYQYILDRISKKLAGWKTSCLSLAGRATLIQSTLSAIPSYTMQTARLPRSICDEIDRKVRCFLWGGTNNVRKIHLANWNSVTKPKELGGLGLRAMRSLNSAQLAKLGWRLCNETESFWSRVLRAKYCRGRCGFDTISARTADSPTWRGIAENVDILCKGSGIAIGNGRTTSFWLNKWAGPEALVDLATGQVPAANLPALVCEYWAVGRGWKWELFSHLLPAATLQAIASFEIVNEDKYKDQLFWRGSSSGYFTLSSAIAICRNEDTLEPEQHWNRLWKTKAPQKMKVFAWLAFQDKLMTNLNRTRRGLTNDPFCSVCGSEFEDVEHVLRTCPRAAWIWRQFARVNLGKHDSEACYRNWFLQNLATTGQDKTWSTSFLIILWYLWQWRNGLCFDNEYIIPHDRFGFLRTKCQEIVRTICTDLREGDVGVSERQEVVIQWMPPPPGWILLNTDGASKGNPGKAGGGGVLRDDKGTWICGFGESMGTCTVMKAEIKAVLRGLRLAYSLDIKRLWVQVDSSTLAGMLKGDFKYCAEHAPILSQCKDLINHEGWQVIISHCYREANKVADTLANMGCNLSSDVVIFDYPPPEVKEVLFADCIGVGWPRMMTK